MRNSIWEYLIPSPSDKESLWNKCIFVFDTNVLLNLYRYTSSTRDSLLKSFQDLKDRVWIPYQVAYEYSKDRFNIIFEALDKYEKLEEAENNLIKIFTNELRVKPSDETIIQLQNYISNWISEQKKKNILVTQVSEDYILDQLLDIFNGKVGTPFSQDELDKIKQEGKNRYENHIPPGFCDSGKAKNGTDNNAYGDLIVWKEIMSFSAKEQKDIIFVTHDQKEDWWAKAKGRTIGPRIELRTEFYANTHQNFYMYSMDTFLEQYSVHRGCPADQTVINEVVDVEYRNNQRSYSNSSRRYIKRDLLMLKRQIDRRTATIETLQNKYKGKLMPPEIRQQLYRTQLNLTELQNRYINLMATSELSASDQHNLLTEFPL